MYTGLFVPCFIDQLYPATALHMIEVLRKANELSRSHMRFHYHDGQTCCGQVAFNGGYWDEARELGKKFIGDFIGYDHIVGLSASCVGMVRNHYPELFYNSALHNEAKGLAKKIYEFTDFIVNVLRVEDLGARLEETICFHDSCAALREYRLTDQPRKLLSKVRGLELVEMKDSDVCCGFGGTFAVKHEAISTAMAEQKIQNALDTGATYIVSTEASCLMHLQCYSDKHNLPVKTIHIADLLAKGLKNK